MSQGLWIAIAVIAILAILALVVGSVLYRRRQVSLRPAPETVEIEAPTPVDRSGGYTAKSGISFTQSSAPATVERPRPPRLDTTGLPGVGDDAAIPRDSLTRPISQVRLPEPELIEEVEESDELDVLPPDVPVVEEIVTGTVVPVAPDLESIAPTAGRLERLRGRLAKSQNAFGRSMLGLLGGGDLDEDSWEEVEDTLLVADLGPTTTTSVVEHLRSAMAAGSVRNEAQARAVLGAGALHDPEEDDPGLGEGAGRGRSAES